MKEPSPEITKKSIEADTDWNDDEIVMSDMTPDTTFVFDRMTQLTIDAVDPKPGEQILDVACGRAIDALALADRGATLYGVEASDVMIDKAYEFLGPKSAKVTIARSLAETLPFADGSFDKVVCKGAMDHFADLEDSMAEMARVTRAGGKVIIAIANFDSLTCRLGKGLWKIKTALTGKVPPDRPFWEPPLDHNFRFDLPVLTRLMNSHCRVKSMLGLSLLWGYPGWGAFTRKLPPPIACATLKSLDFGARLLPGLSDVLIAVGTPRK